MPLGLPPNLSPRGLQDSRPPEQGARQAGSPGPRLRTPLRQGQAEEGSEAHLVCVRFIRLIANKGIRANLLI